VVKAEEMRTAKVGTTLLTLIMACTAKLKHSLLQLAVVVHQLTVLIQLPSPQQGMAELVVVLEHLGAAATQEEMAVSAVVLQGLRTVSQYQDVVVAVEVSQEVTAEMVLLQWNGG
jgi:hypothetical protein